MKKLKIGDVLIHPIHGDMTITNIEPNAQEEFIDDEWRKGETITATFNKFIPSVKWSIGSGDTAKSLLIFNSYYLKNIKVK